MRKLVVGLLAVLTLSISLTGLTLSVAAKDAEDLSVSYYLDFQDDFSAEAPSGRWNAKYAASDLVDWNPVSNGKAVINPNPYHAESNASGTGDAGMMLMGEENWTDYIVETKVTASHANAGIVVRATNHNEPPNDWFQYRGYLIAVDTGAAYGNFVRIGCLGNGAWYTVMERRLSNGYDVTKEHTYRVHCVGSGIGVYVDGKKFMDYSISPEMNFPAGKVGFRAFALDEWKDAGVSFDDFKVYRPRRDNTVKEFELKQVYADSFDSALDASKYSVVRQGNENFSAVTENGALLLTGGSGGFLFQTDLNDYAMSFKMKAPNGSNAGPLLRVQNADEVLNAADGTRDMNRWNAFHVAFDCNGGICFPARNAEPWPAPRQTAFPRPFDKAADWVDVKIVLVKNYFQMYLQGDLVISCYVNTFMQGPVGFRAWGADGIALDDFTLYSVENADLVAAVDDSKTLENIGAAGLAANRSEYGAPSEKFVANGNRYALAKDRNQSVIYAKSQLSDVDVSAKFSGENINAGILFRANMSGANVPDPHTGYFAGFIPSSDYLSIGKWNGGIWTTLCWTKAQGLSGAEHIFRVRTQGALIEAYLDDTLIVTVYDDTIKKGYAGFKAFTYGDYSAADVEIVSFRGENKTYDYSLNVYEEELTNMTLKSAPAKVSYEIGESVDLTGAALELNYTSGVTNVTNRKEIVSVTSAMVSGEELVEAGERTITVSYLGREVTFQVHVAAENEDVRDRQFPVWAIVLIVVLGAGALAGVGFFVFKKTRRKEGK